VAFPFASLFALGFTFGVSALYAVVMFFGVLAPGVAGLYYLRRRHKEFLCSTSWAREQSLHPEDII
jgi:hypothetical protein